MEVRRDSNEVLADLMKQYYNASLPEIDKAIQSIIKEAITEISLLINDRARLAKEVLRLRGQVGAMANTAKKRRLK